MKKLYKSLDEIEHDGIVKHWDDHHGEIPCLRTGRHLTAEKQIINR
ncbi:MAG TPA: hypothetical protein VK957_21460 [Lunatimonas sp.]|nr:hypothetical protein [Lunatimonas sp.]